MENAVLQVLDQMCGRDRSKSPGQLSFRARRIDKEDIEPDQAEQADQDQHCISDRSSRTDRKTFSFLIRIFFHDALLTWMFWC